MSPVPLWIKIIGGYVAFVVVCVFIGQFFKPNGTSSSNGFCVSYRGGDCE